MTEGLACHGPRALLLTPRPPGGPIPTPTLALALGLPFANPIPVKPSPPPSRRGFLLLRLAKWLALAALCLAALLVLGVWVAGRALPSAADSFLASKQAGGLTCEVNDTNLFVGRIHLENLALLNPQRYREREALRIRRLVLDVEPASFAGDGRREIEEMEIDLDRVTLVGGGDVLRDNNLTELGRLLASPGSETAAAGPAEPSRPADFRIRRLKVRVGGLTLIQGPAEGPGRVILREDRGIAFEASDVTADNFGSAVLMPLLGAATQRSLSNPEFLRELSRPRTK